MLVAARYISADGSVIDYWNGLPGVLPKWTTVRKEVREDMIAGNRLMSVAVGPAFALQHMLDADHNERAGCIQGSPRDVIEMFDRHKRQGNKYAMMQFLIAPYRGMTRDTFLRIVLPLLARVMGFSPFHAVVFEHVKKRRHGGTDSHLHIPGQDGVPADIHWHICVSYTQMDTGRVNPGWKWSHAKCELVSRQLEVMFEPENILLGRHTKAVLAQLRSEGKDSIADLIEAAHPKGATPENRTPPLAIEQAAKKLGQNLRDVNAAVRGCWNRAGNDKPDDNRKAFADDLDEQFLTLSVSDRGKGWAVCDEDGNFINLLTKTLPGVSIASILNRIGEPPHDYERIRALEREADARDAERHFDGAEHDKGAAGEVDRSADRDGSDLREDEEVAFIEALERPEFDGAMDRLGSMARQIVHGAIDYIRRVCADMVAGARQWLDKDIDSTSTMDAVTAKRHREFMVYADAASAADVAVFECQSELSQLMLAPKPPAVGKSAHDKRISGKKAELETLTKTAEKAAVARDAAQARFEPTWTAWKEHCERKTAGANRWLAVADRMLDMIRLRPKVVHMGADALYTIAMNEFDRAAAPPQVIKPIPAPESEPETDDLPKPPGMR